MPRVSRGRFSLLTRIMLFLLAFGAALVLETGISRYQASYVLKPMEQRTRNIQVISLFLNDVEDCMTALENYRWDYGDAFALVSTLKEKRLESAGNLAQIQKELDVVGEEQYLLANAAETTYRTLVLTLDEIIENLMVGKVDNAAGLYYSKAEPCGAYLRQYTQQLLEQSILDNRDAYTEFTTLNARLNRLRGCLVFICFVLGGIVVYSLLHLLRCVSQMSRASQAISRGVFDVADVDESQQDEIGHMAKTFNEMKRSMKRQMQLLEEKSEMERQLHKKETEALEFQALMEREKLQQLRSQINPHFLFNTLNVIMYTSQQEGALRTHSLISSLSKLFRYALGSNESRVSLAREVNIVDEFYALYHIRFGDRVNMRWHICPELDLPDIMVPSFILQPLVENAFKHGLGPKEGDGCVDIYIETDGSRLKIRVADDGVGMSRETLERLRQNLRNPPTTGEHIGVYNVAARLRLWGKDHGMDIQSEQGKGTEAILWMPLTTLWDEDGEVDDENTDRG